MWVVSHVHRYRFYTGSAALLSFLQAYNALFSHPAVKTKQQTNSPIRWNNKTFDHVYRAY